MADFSDIWMLFYFAWLPSEITWPNKHTNVHSICIRLDSIRPNIIYIYIYIYNFTFEHTHTHTHTHVYNIYCICIGSPNLFIYIIPVYMTHDLDVCIVRFDFYCHCLLSSHSGPHGLIHRLCHCKHGHTHAHTHTLTHSQTHALWTELNGQFRIMIKKSS